MIQNGHCKRFIFEITRSSRAGGHHVRSLVKICLCDNSNGSTRLLLWSMMAAKWTNFDVKNIKMCPSIHNGSKDTFSRRYFWCYQIYAMIQNWAVRLSLKSLNQGHHVQSLINIHLLSKRWVKPNLKLTKDRQVYFAFINLFLCLWTKQHIPIAI